MRQIIQDVGMSPDGACCSLQYAVFEAAASSY